MSKLEKLFNRGFMFLVFLVTGTRLAVGRILPTPQPGPKPSSAKVFALTEAAWLELRAGGDGANQDTKSSEDKKEHSKSGDDKKEPSKSTEGSKEQSKGSDCDKGGSKGRDDNKGASPSGDDKNKDASKSGECGPGGGDGDTGGSGG
jgi:hypothetical protein